MHTSCGIFTNIIYTFEEVDVLLINAQFIGVIVGGVAEAIIITGTGVRYRYYQRRNGYQPVGGGPNGGLNRGPHGGNGGPKW